MFIPDLKVLDCTIRDGGLINNWKFSDNLVRANYQAACDAGIDYFEIGYKASKAQFNQDEFGKWRFCDEEDVKKVLDGIEKKTKLACMVDIGRVEKKDILIKDKSMFDMIRIACYLNQVDKAIELSKMIQDKGYESTINIMAVSTNLEKDIDEGLAQIGKTDVQYVYVSDTFGHMFSEDITFLIKKYQQFLPGKNIGIHTHNNTQLAFGNTIQAIIDGVRIIDASVMGIGRGAGNCPLELVIGFLKNPKYNLRPIIKLIEDYFVDLNKEIEWGYIIPYMITGILNEHPRAAIELRSGKDKDKYTAFYDKLTTPETYQTLAK